MHRLTFSVIPMCFLIAIYTVVNLLTADVWMAAHAQSSTANGSVIRSTNTTTPIFPIGGNIYATGGSVHPTAAVDGDFVAAGGRVVVDQPVKGDATLAGGSITVRSPIGDDVRAAGGDVRIESVVSGEVFAAAGSITLTKDARVAHAATLYAGSVTVDGKIDGPLKIGAQKILLNGEVLGDVHLNAEQIELGPNTKINGSLHYPASADLKKADGAIISGTITRAMPEEYPSRNRQNREWHRGMQGYGPMWAGSVFTFFALLACATVLQLVFPVFWMQAADIVKTSPGQAIALGLGSLLVLPLLAALLFITILGIPLGIVVMMLYPGLLLVGYLIGIFFIAQRAQLAIRKDTPISFPVAIGIYALTLLAVMLLVRLPFIGPLALIIITILGTGACVIEMNRRRKTGLPASGQTFRPSTAANTVGI
jgi:cytoskeletal protein CcmA (bactofilin family)